MEIIYESNNGFLFRTEKRLFSVDLLCDPKEYPYRPAAEDTKKAIIEGESPYDRMDYMLYTHGHPDHFSGEPLAEYINNGGKAEIIVPYETSCLIDEETFEKYADHIHVLKDGDEDEIAVDEEDIRITAMHFKHEGKENDEVDNVGYLVETGDGKVLHVGDARICRSNYLNRELDRLNIDAMIVPFPYIARKDGVDIMERFIGPVKVVAAHLPPEEKDIFHWIDAAEKSVDKIKTRFGDVVLCSSYHQRIEL